MKEVDPTVWRCLVHQRGNDPWQMATALGARPPCHIPLLSGQLRRLAGRHKIDHITAAILAQDSTRRVRQALAHNYSTPEPVLLALAHDPEVTVREILALSGVPNAVLAVLAADPALRIRLLVASNVNTPARDLERLAMDDNEQIGRAARRNPSAPASIRQGSTDQ